MIAVWRRAAKGGPFTPVVLVLHGRGADEHDLLPVIDRLPRGLSYVSVRGLVDVAEGGYTWFENHGVARPIAKSVRASVGRVRDWLDANVPPPAPLFVLGFSAGMMMGGALLLADPARFAGAVLLSGALALDAGIPCDPGRLAGVPVFAARGTFDDVIPAQLVAATDRYLRERSGADLTQREYPHAHAIALRELQDIAAWLRER
jgi:phospholipase/carboxylesterase